MATAAQQSPGFPWDIDVPNTQFWQSLGEESVTRCFNSCFSAGELNHMNLDPAASKHDKLAQVREILTSTLSAEALRVQPRSFRDADETRWVSLTLGCVTIDDALGQHRQAEAGLKDMLGPDSRGKRNMSMLSNLGWHYVQTQQWSEAEAAAKECLPWLQGIPSLGPGSPQALGCMRVLALSAIGQRHFEEADAWVHACGLSIQRLGQGKLARYVAEEDEALAEVMDKLAKARAGEDRSTGQTV